MIRYDFTGQTAIVSGGTRGIGAAVSKALLQAGAKVIATYGSNSAAAEEFKSSLDELAGNLQLAQFDVSNYQETEEFFNSFDKENESLEILVNCAGIRQDSVLAMMPPEKWQRVLDVNLTGAYNMAKLSLLRMLQNRRGRIVFLSSPAAKIGFAGQTNYCASKAALVSMCRALSKEVARRNISVNCVSPGFIETDFIADLSDKQLKEYRDMVPMKRFGMAEEVANAVLFLASEESIYITGSMLEISGGL